MTCYKVWFDHHEGPYCVYTIADDQRDIEEIYADDPFFLYVTAPDDEKNPSDGYRCR